MKHLRRAFTILGLVGLGIVVYLNRNDLRSFWSLLRELRWYIMAAVVVVQVGSYWLNALYYRSILRIFSDEVGTLRLFEGALATNFVNYVLPSAGLAGAGYLSQVLSPEVPRGVSVLVQLMRYALSALSVLLMMPVGLGLLYAFGIEQGRSVVGITEASAIAITAGAFALVALVQHEGMLRRVLTWLLRRLRRLITPARSEAIWRFVDQFYQAYHSMVSHKAKMLAPFGWSMLYIMVELTTPYMVFLAFGKVVNPGIVVMAYLFANIASIFGGVFFSTGIFELGMAGILVALGVEFTLAVAVTTVYRVANLLIGLPPGFFYYRKYLASHGEATSPGIRPN